MITLRAYLLVRIGSIERPLRSSRSRSRVLCCAMVDAAVRMQRPQCSGDFFGLHALSYDTGEGEETDGMRRNECDRAWNGATENKK